MELAGLKVMFAEQPSACVTVNVCPPAVMVPTRCGPAFAATLYVTVNGLAAPLTVTPVTQLAFETAAGVAHPASLAVTVNTWPEAVPAPRFALETGSV